MDGRSSPTRPPDYAGLPSYDDENDLHMGHTSPAVRLLTSTTVEEDPLDQDRPYVLLPMTTPNDASSRGAKRVSLKPKPPLSAIHGAVLLPSQHQTPVTPQSSPFV